MSAKDWIIDICGCVSNPTWCLITCCCPFITSYRVGVRLGMRVTAIISVIFILLYSFFDLASAAAYVKSRKAAIYSSYDYYDKRRDTIISAINLIRSLYLSTTRAIYFSRKITLKVARSLSGYL